MNGIAKCRVIPADKAPQLFLIYILSKITNEKGIAGRVVFSILQEEKKNRSVDKAKLKLHDTRCINHQNKHILQKCYIHLL